MHLHIHMTSCVCIYIYIYHIMHMYVRTYMYQVMLVLVHKYTRSTLSPDFRKLPPVEHGLELAIYLLVGRSIQG